MKAEAEAGVGAGVGTGEVAVEVAVILGAGAPLTAGAEVEAGVTRTVGRGADLTRILLTIQEVHPDRHLIIHAREADPTTPPIPRGRGQDPARGLPPSCEDEVLQASWTNDGSQVHENVQCPTTDPLQVPLRLLPRVGIRRERLLQLGQNSKGRRVESRIPPIMFFNAQQCYRFNFQMLIVYKSFVHINTKRLK